MEGVVEKIGATLFQCLIFWALIRYIVGIFCSPIVARWIAHSMLIGLLCGTFFNLLIFGIGLGIGLDIGEGTFKDFLVLLPYSLFLSLNFVILPLFYWWDKKASCEKDAERIPEFVLHSLAMIGGGPGAIFSQRFFNHKTTKESFKYLKWLAIITSIIMYYKVLL